MHPSKVYLTLSNSSFINLDLTAYNMGLDTVELVMKIERHFAIRIPDAEAEHMATVQDFYDVVAWHLTATVQTAIHLETTINEIISDHAGLPVEEILPHKSITSDLGLD